MASYLHRGTAKNVPSGGKGCDPVEVFPTELAALGEFILAETWPDGSERTPGSLVVFREGFKLKACLSDKDQGTIAFVSAGTWDELLELAEAGLRSQQLDWREQRDRRR